MTPPRRWFRFSLRTMLIVVTALACWLGWELHIVHERRRLLDEIMSAQNGETDTVPYMAYSIRPMTIDELRTAYSNKMVFWRYWMGDVRLPSGSLQVPWPPNSPKFDEAARLFPECWPDYSSRDSDPSNRYRRFNAPAGVVGEHEAQPATQADRP